MKLFTIVLIITTLNLSACNSTKMNTNNTKTADQTESTKITDIYWKLVTLEGKSIADAENPHDQPHFMLNTKDNRVTGNGGCNGFFGNYALTEKGKLLKFEQLGSTKRMCANTVVNEYQFMQTLAKVDKYSIKNKTLTLSVGDNSPLAVFKALKNQQ